MSAFDQPIVVIGAARSGTDLVAGLIASHPDVFLLREPNFVWKYSNAGLGHDMIPASRATPKVREYVRGRFGRHLIASGRPRLCEKTPANALRLPYVLAILPEARIVHIVRDGRDVAVSARKMMRGQMRKVSRRELAPSGKASSRHEGPLGVVSRAGQVLRRVRNRSRPGFPLRDTLHYVPDFVSNALAQMDLKDHAVWGPRIPGLRKLLKSHTLIEVAALQWRMCIDHVGNFLAHHPEVPSHEIRFEHLCEEPMTATRELLRFCELEPMPSVEARAERILPATPRSFERELSKAEVDLIHGHIAQRLVELGYEL